MPASASSWIGASARGEFVVKRNGPSVGCTRGPRIAAGRPTVDLLKSIPFSGRFGAFFCCAQPGQICAPPTTYFAGQGRRPRPATLSSREPIPAPTNSPMKASRSMSWYRPFDDPILLPKGKPLIPLKDAALYVQRLYEDATDGRYYGRTKRPIFLVQTKILRKFFEYPILDRSRGDRAGNKNSKSKIARPHAEHQYVIQRGMPIEFVLEPYRDFDRLIAALLVLTFHISQCLIITVDRGIANVLCVADMVSTYVVNPLREELFFLQPRLFFDHS